MDNNKKDKRTILLKKYFEENSLVESNIASFKNFIDFELQKIVDANKVIEPTIIPHNVEEFKIKFDKIWVTKPEMTEADGSKRNVFPVECRLRKISYSAPIFMEVSAHINGVQRESFVTQIGQMPIMLKSKYCHLNKMTRDELIQIGEDPDDYGGYFIVNGTEKVIIGVEDLASNRLMVEKQKIGISEYIGKIFSEGTSFKIPHTIEKLKDGIFYLSFTRVKRIPIIVIVKALGLTKDEDIMNFVNKNKNFDSLLVNLYEFVDIKNEEDALDYIAKKTGITQSKEVRIERMREIMDKYLLSHVGSNPRDRVLKAYNICKLLNKFVLTTEGEIIKDDKDHYANKRIKLAGDLLSDLFTVNLKVLINDLLYNFQRIVKRGKFPSIKVIIRDKLLTQRIYSSMATGSWVGGRKGISQRIQRHNFLDATSHLQRIVSPLSASQENFQARELHPTHCGRLCSMETPEGTNIGLRKNLAVLAKISLDSNEEELIKSLKGLGLKTV
ncbi:DNA-directed RNA polymerase subunit B'' [Candidatus Woesearchaeota archaeon]|nr:DNA-directed RNA polymerase subunit B'' [Candidatus Woesearchaeota archaeon]